MDIHIAAGWPQYIYMALVLIGILYTGVHNGESKGTYNVGVTIASACITISILAWGGFFS